VSAANIPALTGRQACRGSGVYLADPQCRTAAPRQVAVDGRKLSRFMDLIYLDRPCDKLSVKKIQVLNAARRPLLQRQDIGAVNSRVRLALAHGLRAAGARRVLEWGIGFHPMHELLGDVSYCGVDIDPAVVEAARANHPGLPFHALDRDLAEIGDASSDAIVSAFVFHFRLSRLHLATMRRALTPSGILLANVYRRSMRSRRELVAEFNQAGMRVDRVRDAQELCVDHEIWCVTHADHPDVERGAAALTAVQEALRE
jgi:SAM-dependent methyltransferase